MNRETKVCIHTVQEQFVPIDIYSFVQLLRVFFSKGMTLRDLHSFPTRRSSDLSQGDDPLRERRARDHAGCVRRRGGPQAAERDRKSTRLNSSHVAISYAVFCLKKKTSTSTSSISSCAAMPRRARRSSTPAAAPA